MKNIDFGNVEVRQNELLSKHSSFKVGGEARYALFPRSSEEIMSAIDACEKNGCRYRIIGNASNILFDDNGFDGVIIFTGGINSTQYIHKKGYTIVKVDCGKSLTELSSEVGKKHGLSGLEFAYGIPGTVGGAIFMNAGAYGGQMSDVTLETEYVNTTDGKIYSLKAEEQDFGYRHSMFQDHPEYVVISSTLKLSEREPADILADMSKNMTARKEKQPLEYPNAGSTFKRPPNGLFAGKLIEDSGLKGFTVGGAQVSEKHAGFIINKGGATSADILELMKHIQKIVLEKFNVKLEPEIIYIPYQ